MTSKQSANDVIRLPRVTFEFVENKPKWWCFRMKSRAPSAQDRFALTTMDYLGVWYLRNGHQLQSAINKLGLGPEPSPEEDFNDLTCDDDEWREIAQRLATFSTLVLPPVFGGLVDEWLRDRTGRRVRIEVDGMAATGGSLPQIEAILSKAGRANG